MSDAATSMNDSDRAFWSEGGWFELVDQTQLWMTGKDRLTLLHNLSTQNVKSLAAGEGGEAWLLDARGRVLDGITLFADAEQLWIDAEPGRSAFLLRHFDKYTITEDAAAIDATSQHRLFHLVGARIADWANDQWPSVAAGRLFQQRIRLAEADVILRRFPRRELPGLDLLAPIEAADRVRDWLRSTPAVGAEQTAERWEVLRLQAGIPSVEQELADERFPQELGRVEHKISFTKGCYLGQETVARIDAHGHVNKHLVGLQSSAPMPVGMPLFVADQNVGTVTSAAMSDLLGPIGLGVVRTKFANSGHWLNRPDHGPPIEVRSLPMLKPT